jgi:hypothetical protein
MWLKRYDGGATGAIAALLGQCVVVLAAHTHSAFRAL